MTKFDASPGTTANSHYLDTARISDAVHEIWLGIAALIFECRFHRRTVRLVAGS